MSHRRGFRPRTLIRRLLRAQLRLKVMAGVVVVTLVALVAFDIGAVTTMRRYLLAQTDNNLQAALTLTLPRLTAILGAVLRWTETMPCPRNSGRRPAQEPWRCPAPSTWPSCRSAANRSRCR